MMHNRCSSSHNMVGPCSCGLFHTQSNSSLSMLFSSIPTSVHKPTAAAADENYDPYSYPNSYAYPYPYSAATSVDCTLSLGTPSTRMSEDSAVDGDGRRIRGGGNGGGGQERRSSISNFCWDILGQSKHAPSSQSQKGAARGGGSNSSSGSSSCSGDPLLARRCANCDTTSTPLWRNGPRGPKSLCNACGIRFKKEERRASAAAASANTGPSGGGGGGMESQQLYSHHNHYSSWGAAPAAPQQKVPCYGNEFRFIDDDGRDSDNGISFMSWRLNVTDRPSGLVHDFTR